MRIPVPIQLAGWLTVAAPGQSPRDADHADLLAAGYVLRAERAAEIDRLIRSLDRYRRALHQCAAVLRVYVRAQGVDRYQSQHDPLRVSLAAFEHMRTERDVALRSWRHVVDERNAANARATKAEAALAAERAAANQTIADLHDRATKAEARVTELDAECEFLATAENRAKERAGKAESDLAASRALVERMLPVVDAARAYVHAPAGERSCTTLGTLCEAVAKLDKEKP